MTRLAARILMAIALLHGALALAEPDTQAATPTS
jgi:hypothetical protein